MVGEASNVYVEYCVCVGVFVCVCAWKAMPVKKVIARNNNKSLKAWTVPWQNLGGDFLPVHHRGPAIGPPWTRLVASLLQLTPTRD